MLFQHSKVFHSMHIMQELHTNRPNFQHSFQHALQISTCAEIFNMLFQNAFNIVFNMHYRFQHALQISTCITDFNMHYRFQHVLKFSTCFFKMFQHISNMKFTCGMNHVENFVENHVKYFKVY